MSAWTSRFPRPPACTCCAASFPRGTPRAVRYAIAVPDGVHALDRVAYVLPGRGGDAESVVGLGLDGFLAAYLRAGGRGFALAAMDAGESYFHPRAAGEDRLTVATVDFPRVVRGVLGVSRCARR